MIKAILFDFDGVLTTDATGSESVCKYLSRYTGLDYGFVLGVYRKYNRDLLYGKCTHSDIWGNFCEDIHRMIGIDILYDSFANTPIDHEMIDLVRKLKCRRYKTGMVTDNKTDRIEKIMTHYGWRELFDVVAISANIGSGKDHREIFLEALSRLQLQADECVFIDNNRKNLIVPADMGMKGIYFDDEERDMLTLISALNGYGINI